MPTWPLLVLLLGCVVLTGCETTKEKSARLAAVAQSAVKETGVSISQTNADVTVQSAEVVQDENGTAVVVTVRNRGSRPQLGVPLLVDVRGTGGASLFRNDAPGLAPSLTSIPAIGPGEELSWVNDQVTASGPAASARAVVGAPTARANGRPARLKIVGTKLQGDETSGIEATGTVTNTTAVLQRDVTLYVVGRKGSRVVAAGRAAIPRLAAGAKAVFHAFFIGDPTGTTLQVSAPVVAP